MLLCKFRVQAHSLNIETGRYCKTPLSQRVCALCDTGSIEDEFHFILTCPAFSELRQRFIKKYYYRRTSVFKLVQILSIQNTKTLSNLGKFLYHATERRTLLLSQMN